MSRPTGETDHEEQAMRAYEAAWHASERREPGLRRVRCGGGLAPPVASV
ncbi:hypothetical protein AB0K60_06545 [Thermopolyspora sp. NPDC052614]